MPISEPPIKEYLHNLSQLRRALLKLGLAEPAAEAAESIQAAEEYRKFKKRNRFWLALAKWIRK